MRYIFCWGRLEDLRLYVLGGRSKGMLWKPIYLLARFFSIFASRDYKEGRVFFANNTLDFVAKKTPKRAHIIFRLKSPFHQCFWLALPWDSGAPYTCTQTDFFSLQGTIFQKIATADIGLRFAPPTQTSSCLFTRAAFIV